MFFAEKRSGVAAAQVPHLALTGNQSADARPFLRQPGASEQARETSPSQIALQLFYILKQSGMKPDRFRAHDVLLQVIDKQGPVG